MNQSFTLLTPNPPTVFMEEGKADVVEEAFRYFRANCFFRNFEIQSPGDRLMIYVTLCIQEYLQLLGQKQASNQDVATKLLQTGALEFKIPGEPGFNLTAIYAPPEKAEVGKKIYYQCVLMVVVDLLKQYLTQLRQETASRLVTVLFNNSQDGKPSKWWMSFQKRKFMGKSL